MRPGSSYRCKSRATLPNAVPHPRLLRCRGRIGHTTPHRAPTGRLTLCWIDETTGTFEGLVR